MSAPTPEAVARELVSEFTWSTARDQLGVSANHEEIVTRIASAIHQRDRAARAAAIEEAAREIERLMAIIVEKYLIRGAPTFESRALVGAGKDLALAVRGLPAPAIRALGEESAAPREEATS